MIRIQIEDYIVIEQKQMSATANVGREHDPDLEHRIACFMCVIYCTNVASSAIPHKFLPSWIYM